MIEPKEPHFARRAAGATRHPFRRAALAVAALAFAAPWAQAAHTASFYALAGDGTSLISFNNANPGAVTTVGSLSGATTRLDGLDFRPANGALYGYSAATSGIYRVDLLTGATTLTGTSTAPVGAQVLGIDFNPVPDRLRVVTDQADNRRINVDGGAAIIDGTLAFGAGDANFGVAPRIADAAYTNSDINPATGTTLYYIDYALDMLISTANPNAGVLNTVGLLGVDTSELVGFDIFTDAGGGNTAYASLTVGGLAGLYGINLMTGAATLIGSIGAVNVNGLTAVPVPVSAPGTLALVAAAGMALVVGRRRGGASTGLAS